MKAEESIAKFRSKVFSNQRHLNDAFFVPVPVRNNILLGTNEETCSIIMKTTVSGDRMRMFSKPQLDAWRTWSITLVPASSWSQFKASILSKFNRSS